MVTKKRFHASTCPQRFAQTGAPSKQIRFRVAMQAGAKAQRREKDRIATRFDRTKGSTDFECLLSRGRDSISLGYSYRYFCGTIFALPRLVPAIFRHLRRRLAVGSLNPTNHSITKGLFPPDLAKDSSFIGRESGSRSPFHLEVCANY
jgi:hypothetical protein